MKTFKEFLFEASTTHKLKLLVAKKISERPSNVEVYKNLLKRIREREAPSSQDYPERQSARKDKMLYPSYRMSSHPYDENRPTITKNPKKLRKQKALGEIL